MIMHLVTSNPSFLLTLITLGPAEESSPKKLKVSNHVPSHEGIYCEGNKLFYKVETLERQRSDDIKGNIDWNLFSTAIILYDSFYKNGFSAAETLRETTLLTAKNVIELERLCTEKDQLFF